MPRTHRGNWKIEDVASSSKGLLPTYSPHGYVIADDGTIHTLLYQWYHGIVLAILFPKIAKAQGYKPPSAKNDNVFKFQRFELDNHDKFSVIRICPGRLMGHCSVSKGEGPATDEQIAALRLVMKACGLGPRDMVHTDVGDRTVLKSYDLLKRSRDDMWSVK